MRKLLSFFARAWVVSLIGVLFVSVLIWFAGPFVAFAGWAPLETELARLVTIGLIFLLWLLRRLWVWQIEKRTNTALVEGLSAERAEDDGNSRSAEEVAALQRRLTEALSVLRKTRLGPQSGARRTQKLYQLPWYLLIGPPGSGKTTALLNSGLRFPLEERFGKGAIGGVGGTRNCDWFFTDQAVLLDTAGRYTTQDSDSAVDSAAWEGFLNLLRKHRRRRPINGVLVAISLADLMSQNESQRMDHAVTIRRRLQDLHKHLGIRFPVYVLFTKCDLLSGFMEFFDDLGREERAQVWGTTFPYDDGGAEAGVVTRFGDEFEDLEQGLNTRLVERLQEERDPRRRSLIYGFPRQFSSLRPIAEQFLVEAFRPTRYEERTLLRGVYFTSGTQEGSPIDRLMGTLARSFGLERPQTTPLSGSGRSYFIQRLLTDVVFPESELAGANLRLERGRAWLQRGAWAAAIGIAALTVAAWVTSYVRNSSYVERVDAQSTEIEQLLAEVPADDASVEAVLPVLAAARNIEGGHGQRDASVPLTMGLGLYQGDKLGGEAEGAYRRLLRTLLLPRIMLRMEEQLSDSSASYDFLYEGLKAYLMLGDSQHFDAETVRAWVDLDWDQNLTRRIQADQLILLREHLNALLAAMPMPLPMPLQGDLIASVRDYLQRVPLADRVYQRLRRAQLADGLPEFKVTDGAGRDAPLVFVRRSGEPLNTGVPGFFTAKGYRDAFLGQSSLIGAQLSAETWVLGNQLTPEDAAKALLAVSEEVKQLYLMDYARQWQDLLADIDIAPIAGVEQATEVLRVSSGPSSPIKLMLQAVERQTALSRVEQNPAAVQEQVRSGLSGVKERLASLIGDSGAAAALPDTQVEPNLVEQRFERLNALVRGSDSGPAPIDGVVTMLDEAFVLMSSIASATGRGDAAVQIARDQAGGTLGRIKLEAQRQPQPLSRWLEALAAGGTGVALGGARAHLNDVYQGDVQQLCREATSNRYPFNPGSSAEIGLDDFGRLFSSGGLLDRFFNEQLRPFVDTSGKPWRWRGDASRQLGMSDGVLAQFQRASEIRDAFFASGGPTPRVGFQLKPLAMDAQISQFLLTIDGQTVSYSHGPARPTALQWPGPDGVGQAHMQISPPAPGGRSSVNMDGPWALFRLLDQSALQPTGVPEHFRVRFQIGGRTTDYELRAGSARNPFNLNALRRFRCPGSL